MNKSPLSVVIIGRNEGQRLVDCIRSVQAMNDPPEGMEIIYVDSDSTDGSPERAKTLGIKVLVVHPERPAAAIGRNAGWRAAKAPLILFLDGDTILHPDFVKEAKQSLDNDPKVAIVWGHRRELYPNASWYQRILDLDWIYSPGLSDFCGGDALMRRHVLEEVGGYNPQIIAAEDNEICQRIRANRYSILHIDKPMTKHDLAITRWSQYWLRATRTGHAFAEVSNLSRNTTGLWLHESRKHWLHAGILIGIFVIGLIISLGLKSLWPFFSSILLFLLLSLRSAWRARWKSKNFLTLFLYGLHSQFQHIPIVVGQWSYYYHRWRGQRRRLIEYK